MHSLDRYINDDLLKAALAHDASEYREANTLLGAEVKLGNPLAHYLLGLSHLHGHGVPEDVGLAISWFEEAGRMGLYRGALMAKMLTSGTVFISEPFNEILSTRYEFLLIEWNECPTAEAFFERGNECAEEGADPTAVAFRSAISCFQAALDGNRDSQNHLGFRFVTGGALPLNHAAAAFWHEVAADRGDLSSLHDLGRMRELGIFYEQDFEGALAYYQKAAELGLTLAKRTLGLHLLRGDLGVLHYPKAFYWLDQAAKDGDDEAQAGLGFMYRNALGCIQDLEKSNSLWKLASEQGNSIAQSYLAKAYLYGWGVDIDVEEAARLYKESAADDNADGVYMLACMYLDGIGVPLDLETSYTLFQKAADLGHAEASFHLGSIHEFGDYGAEVNIPLAKKYCLRAAELGHKSGAFNLGNLLCVHPECDEDITQGRTWLEKADALGHPRAKLQLAVLSLTGQLGTKDPIKAAGLLRQALGAEIPEDLRSYAEYHLALALKQSGVSDEHHDEVFQLFLKSAADGFAPAQRESSKLLWQGVGCEQSFTEALKWALLAESGGDEVATQMKEAMQEHLSHDEVEIAQRLARDYIPQHQDTSSSQATR